MTQSKEAPADKTYTACLIIIGNEILSGRTRDANLQYLGAELGALGIRMSECRVIPDIEAMIVATVNEARIAFDYVFTTGGIGPTHDDITAAAVAKALGTYLERNEEAEKLLHAHYQPEDRTAARMKMADIPVGGELLYNPVSNAPGFRLENVYVLPGVPSIMQAMFDGFRSTLAGGRAIQSRTIQGFVQEGVFAEHLSAVQEQFPGVDIGSYPFFRDKKPGASFVIRGDDVAALDGAAEAIKDAMTKIGVEPIEDAV